MVAATFVVVGEWRWMQRVGTKRESEYESE